MNTYFRQIEPKYMGRQQNYKVVIRYWSLVSRCHLSDRLTLLMYTRIDKCGERLLFCFRAFSVIRFTNAEHATNMNRASSCSDWLISFKAWRMPSASLV